MAVYREGYHIIEALLKQHKQVWQDSADYGILIKHSDKNWNMVKQLVDTYGIKGSRVHHGERGVSQKVKLIDEWAVSDARKTLKEATEVFQIDYWVVNGIKNVDGLLTVHKEQSEQDHVNNCHVCGRKFKGNSALCGRCERDVE
jgi:hypothetical protein